MELQVMDFVGPLLGAVGFVLLMSLIREPARKQFNAVFVGGAAGAYVAGGFGVWELTYVLAGAYVAYLGLKSYRFIAIAWLMHTGWDLMHHFYGNPIWPFMETSSLGCAILDAAIALWFWVEAPSVFDGSRRRRLS
ncbi:MAG: DUF6010 family protein [Deltaproteobacteria bacterium]